MLPAQLLGDLLRGAGLRPSGSVEGAHLVERLAAGELNGVFVCARRVPLLAPVEPPPPPAEARATEPEAAMAAASPPAAGDETLPAAADAADTGSSNAVEEQAAAPEPEAAPAPEAAAEEPAPPAAPLPAPAAFSDECTLHACAAGEPLPPALHGCPAVHLACVGDCGGGGPAAHPDETGITCTLLPDGPSLGALHQLLSLVLAPWLAAQLEQAAGVGADAVDIEPSTPGGVGDGSGGTTAELLAATHKLAAQAAACARHLRSDVARSLPAMPPGTDLADPAAAARSEEAVLACERCMEGWVQLATGVLQREGSARPEGRGPLAELELWRRRAEAYASVEEQLGVPVVRAAVKVVELGSLDASLSASFQNAVGELARAALDARDNCRFLATLERHLRALDAGSLQAAVDALQPLLNALRMIWNTSRHFGDDVQMSGLLERIAHAIEDRLVAALDVRALFAAPVEAALALVRTCRALAQGWQAHYLSARERIEASGHPVRWEFSRQVLFEHTNYAAEVCAELEGMLQAADDFRRFLGPQLRAVTGEAGVIDDMARMVQAMVEPVAGLDFSPLDRSRASSWRAAAGRYGRDADDVRLATRDLIDACFRRLRSVDAAVQLLHSFQGIQVQGAVQQQMADKLAAVLEHFTREIHSTRRLFEEGRSAPPLTRNMPPVAGGIRWSRTLLGRVRRTWLRLKDLNGELEGLDAGRRAAAAMMDLAKSMLQFEKARFAAWAATVDAAVTAGLQQPLLIRQAAAVDGVSVSSTTAPPPGRAAAALAINFPPALLLLAREAKYLGQLGCAVPRLAVNLALQEGQLRSHFQDLGAMLARHAAAGAGLRPPEQALLGEQRAALDAALEPGLGRLNWSSLTIHDYVVGVNKAVDQFETLAAQVLKNVAAIERAISSISRVSLVPPLAAAAPTAGVAAPAGARGSEAGAGAEASGSVRGLPDLPDFYEEWSHHRQQVVGGLVARYRSLPQLLQKIEELVAGTSSGKAPRLAGYYAFYERRVLAAINAAVVQGLQAFHDRLRACRPPDKAKEGGEEEAAAPPLFRVSLSLMQGEVVVAPSMQETARLLGRLLRNVAESARPLVRWMDGTCLEAPPQHVYGDGAEPFVFSFFAYVSQSPAAIKAMLLAQHEVQHASAGVGKLAERWRAYGPLWRSDRAGELARLSARRPSLSAVEELMARYQRLGEDAAAAGADCQVHFISVSCAPLAAAAAAEAQAWVQGIGQTLMDGLPAPAALLEQATSLLEAVQRQPADAANVEAVQAAIDEALSGAAAALEACADLEERCQSRLECAAAGGDADSVQAELACIGEAVTAWRRLQTAAGERQAQGVSLPPPPPPPPAAEGGEASAAAAETVGGEEAGEAVRRPSSSVRGSLARTESSVSAASSVASRGSVGRRQQPQRSAARLVEEEAA